MLAEAEIRDLAVAHRQSVRGQIVSARIAAAIELWRVQYGESKGIVLAGSIDPQVNGSEPCELKLQVVYTLQGATEECGSQTVLFAPITLAVLIPPPQSNCGELWSTTRKLLQSGIRQLWIVSPDRKTIQLQTPDRPIRFFAEPDVIDSEPDLPGFRLPLKSIFK